MKWALLFLVACQKHADDKPAPPPVDTDKCKLALETAPTVPPARRAKVVLEGCKPCGEWQPLLHWQARTTDGGPTRLAIDQQLQACGTCNTDARTKFMGALDDARGTDARTPWREYGKACNLADGRFVSAPWYALDKIARDAGANPDLAPLLAGIELRMPAVSLTGSGYELPTASVVGPHAGPAQITVTAGDLRMGVLPTGKLTPQGLVADTDYPGAPLDAAKLVDGPVAILAPKGLPARRVLDAILPGKQSFLAVVAPGQPEGWMVPGVVPVQLTKIDGIDGTPQRMFTLTASADALLAELKAKPAGSQSVLIQVAADATAQSLAQLLGALAFTGSHAAMIMASQP